LTVPPKHSDPKVSTHSGEAIWPTVLDTFQLKL